MFTGDTGVKFVPSVELSQFNILPTYPVKDKLPLPFEQAETDAIVPGTVVGLTVTVTVNVAPGQVPDIGVTV